MQGSLSVERMCRVAGVSRASFYRWLEPTPPVEQEVEVRAAIQAIVLEHRRRYGYRRVTRELRDRGCLVNHKRVARLMSQDNLLAVQPQAWVTTTNSSHQLPVYLNLAMRMNVTGINQLWVSDITYIRLAGEFVYLAVVLDVYSRKVVGWELGRSLGAQLAVNALRQAIEDRQPPPGLVHHSDRGLQYCCLEYAQLLESYGIVASMSRPGNPYDNAFCESFMRSLKREEIHANVYRDLDDLRTHIQQFIEQYYNRARTESTGERKERGGGKGGKDCNPGERSPSRSSLLPMGWRRNITLTGESNLRLSVLFSGICAVRLCHTAAPLYAGYELRLISIWLTLKEK